MTQPISNDEFGRTPWEVEAIVTDPNRRTRVHVIVTVRPDLAADRRLVDDAAEIAQQAATQAMSKLDACRVAIAEEPPF